jgi:N-formylglutamate amidohydrolase
MRVAGGLGTVPRIVGDGQEIYGRAIPAQDAMERIEAYYRPYHAALRGLISRTRTRFGFCVLIDMHSMPSTGLEREAGLRPDIIIGDRFGTSAAAHHVDETEAALREAGFSVSRNRPYAGGYITEHYGQPRSQVHAIQIEINRSLYMNEATLQPLRQAGEVKAALTRGLARFFAGLTSDAAAIRLAAE